MTSSSGHVYTVYFTSLTADPWVAAGADGTLYLTGGDEYEVLSLDSSGEARWLLRVDWPRAAFAREDVESLLRSHGIKEPERAFGELEVPDRAPALSSAPGVRTEAPPPIAVDGEGHLYVFPYVRRNWERQASRPVDVYSSSGELVVNGVITGPPWVEARDGFVYGFARDENGNHVIVRSRIHGLPTDGDG